MFLRGATGDPLASYYVKHTASFLLKKDFGGSVPWRATFSIGAICTTILLASRKVFCKAKVDQPDLPSRLVNHNVLSLEVPEDDLLLVKVVEQEKDFGRVVSNIVHRDAYLVPLELIQGDPFDRLHQEVYVHLTLES